MEAQKTHLSGARSRRPKSGVGVVQGLLRGRSGAAQGDVCLPLLRLQEKISAGGPARGRVGPCKEQKSSNFEDNMERRKVWYDADPTSLDQHCENLRGILSS